MKTGELRECLKDLPDDLEVDVYRPVPGMSGRLGTFHEVISAGVFEDAEPPNLFLITSRDELV